MKIKYPFLSKLEILIGTGITFLYFIPRLVNLTILPVFADEAIYVRWAQVMKAESTLRFLPVTDGKQPLYMWLLIPLFKYINDPLYAGRFLSILTGLATLVGIFFLAYILFKSKRIGLIACFFFAVIPFSFFFNRMALVDSMLAMFNVWVLCLGVLLVRNRRLDLAMITGIVFGGALLTKSPATFFGLLLPSTILVSFKRLSVKWLKSITSLVLLWIVVFIFGYAIYNVLRLGPDFDKISSRNLDYVYPLTHFFQNPLDPLVPHIRDIWDWYGTLLTWPIFGVSILGIFFGLKKYFKETVLLLIWVGIPLIVQAEYAKVFTARYILFTVPAFLFFTALFFDELGQRIKKTSVFMFILLLFALWPLVFDYLLITNPEKAPLPRAERSGYLEEWTAGTGIKETASYIKEEAKRKSVLIGTEGYFGTLPDGLQIYLEKVPNITVIGVGILFKETPQPLISSLVDNDVYLVINNERLGFKPEDQNFTVIKTFPKAQRPDGTRQSLLFLKLEPIK